MSLLSRLLQEASCQVAEQCKKEREGRKGSCLRIQEDGTCAWYKDPEKMWRWFGDCPGDLRPPKDEEDEEDKDTKKEKNKKPVNPLKQAKRKFKNQGQ